MKKWLYGAIAAVFGTLISVGATIGLVFLAFHIYINRAFDESVINPPPSYPFVIIGGLLTFVSSLVCCCMSGLCFYKAFKQSTRDNRTAIANIPEVSCEPALGIGETQSRPTTTPQSPSHDSSGQLYASDTSVSSASTLSDVGLFQTGHSEDTGINSVHEERKQEDDQQHKDDLEQETSDHEKPSGHV